jgi:hypothetical protein
MEKKTKQHPGAHAPIVKLPRMTVKKYTHSKNEISRQALLTAAFNEAFMGEDRRNDAV